MLLTLMLALGTVPTQADVDEAVQSAEQAEVAQLRESVRLRGGVSLAGGIARGFAKGAIGFGAGLAVDVGVVWADRFAVTAHFSLVIFLIAAMSLQFEVALSDHVNFGVGASWGGFGFLDGAADSYVGLPLG